MNEHVGFSGMDNSTLSGYPVNVPADDERVSLTPLSPETALRGLLATPPAKDQT